jgi:eukaryotic-like serine/threonine-protein kinase
MASGVQAPARLGRYELLARIATGGMGEIFLARLEGAAGFEKLYVVKRILPHLADDARFRQMLIGEARVASKLAHANICQVYELGETDGQLYIVMEYLEGVTLLAVLRRASKDATPLAFGFVAGVVQQTTDALHYAHELRDRGGESFGIVHRDVTPANVFLTESGVAKLLDFGIAKVKDATANTQTGTIKGKYAYMAPEQLRGQGVDRRADVFALAVVIYEMLALRRLFQRKTDYLTFRAVMEQPIPDVRRYREDVPDAFAGVLARSLDRDPAIRPDSTRQLSTALLDALPGIRPWTQGELGDFVREGFADEISRRGELVHAAVHRSRTSPPSIDSGAMAPLRDDDDDGFPSVEGEADSLDGDATSGTAMPPEFHGHTPPPFAGDPSFAGPGLHALPPKLLVEQKRNFVWPLIAVAMVGIAGGALFLVWRQMRQQPPAVVNITTAPRAADPGSAAVPAPPLAEVPRLAGSAVTPPTPPSRPPLPRPRRSPYDDAIQLHRASITQCAKQHGPPPTSARVVIVVTTAGKAKSISLEPSSLDSSPLGTCIKGVLAAARYPRSPGEMQVSVGLHTAGA